MSQSEDDGSTVTTDGCHCDKVKWVLDMVDKALEACCDVLNTASMHVLDPGLIFIDAPIFLTPFVFFVFVFICFYLLFFFFCVCVLCVFVCFVLFCFFLSVFVRVFFFFF